MLKADLSQKQSIKRVVSAHLVDIKSQGFGHGDGTSASLLNLTKNGRGDDSGCTHKCFRRDFEGKGQISMPKNWLLI
jgi:hypothetical protein